MLCSLAYKQGQSGWGSGKEGCLRAPASSPPPIPQPSSLAEKRLSRNSHLPGLCLFATWRNCEKLQELRWGGGGEATEWNAILDTGHITVADRREWMPVSSSRRRPPWGKPGSRPLLISGHFHALSQGPGLFPEDFESQLCHVLVVQCWVSYLTPLSLGFPIH